MHGAYHSAGGTTRYRCGCGWSSDFLSLLMLHELFSNHEEGEP